MAKAEVKVEEERVGIRFRWYSDKNGFHWLSLDEVWDFQRDFAVAIREAWVNHEENRAKEIVTCYETERRVGWLSS